MERFFGKSIRLAAATLLIANMAWTTGCATLMNGTRQTVTVKTTPTIGAVRFQGDTVLDGHMVTVHKGFYTPQFTVPGNPTSHDVNMQYDPSPWLLGDAALLLAGVWPGVVAFTVDFATGSWRNLDEEQTVNVPGPMVTPAAFRTGYSW